MNNYTFYHFIYYKLYKLAIKTEKQWKVNMQIPEIVAAVTFSVLLLLNVALVLICLYKFFNIDIDVTPTIGILSIGILYVLKYYIFIYKKKYLLILEYFDREKKEKGKQKTIIFWIYLIISLSFYLIIWI